MYKSSFNPFSYISMIVAVSSFCQTQASEEEKVRIDAIIAPFTQNVLVLSKDDKDILTTSCYKPSQEKKLQNATTIFIETKPNEHNEVVLRKIIPGQDGRAPITKTDIWPSSVHGVISMKFNDTSYFGTGILIAPNLVLTAAHNLYSRDDQCHATNVRFFPAKNGRLLPFGEATVKDFYFPEQYKNNEIEDYGLLILGTPIGERAGYFGLSIFPYDKIQGQTVSIMGYPGDKVQDKKYDHELWGMEGAVVGSDPDRIFYNIDTNKGQSGSGVYYQGGKDECFVVGIHVNGDRELGVNRATLITKNRYDQVIRWIEQSQKNVNLIHFNIGDYGAQKLASQIHKHIQKVDLSHNNITDIGAVALASTSLKILILNNNKIKDEGAIAFTVNATLTELDLSHNQIGDSGKNALQNYSSLRKGMIITY